MYIILLTPSISMTTTSAIVYHLFGIAIIDFVVMYAFYKFLSARRPERRSSYKRSYIALGVIMFFMINYLGKDRPPFKPWPWDRVENQQVKLP